MCINTAIRTENTFEICEFRSCKKRAIYRADYYTDYGGDSVYACSRAHVEDIMSAIMPGLVEAYGDEATYRISLNL